MAFPPARGMRIAWTALPETLRRRIELELGAPVVSTTTAPDGFSPAFVARVELADGSRSFVKATSSTLNPRTVELYRDEQRAMVELGQVDALEPFLPHFHSAFEHEEWMVLRFDVVDGRTPELPWRSRELEQVLVGLEALGEVLQPSPIANLVSVDHRDGARFSAFTRYRAQGCSTGDRFADANLELLCALEEQWPEAASGTAALHGDLRADNFLLRDDGSLVVCDWPYLARGAAVLDLVLLAPSVAMQGGPAPEELLAATTTGAEAPRSQVLPLVVGFTGMLLESASSPEPPTLPGLRDFQAAQAAEGLAWLARLLT